MTLTGEAVGGTVATSRATGRGLALEGVVTEAYEREFGLMAAALAGWSATLDEAAGPGADEGTCHCAPLP